MSKNSSAYYDLCDELLKPSDPSYAAVLPGSDTKLHKLPNRPTFMVQADIAKIYGVKTHELNQARRRNPKKFEDGVDYFQLEKSDITDCDIAYNGGHLPYAYTRRGAYMFATILQTDEAVEQAIQIVEGFMAFERILEQKQTPPPQPAPALPSPPPSLPDGMTLIDKDELIELYRRQNKLSKKRERNPFTAEHKRYMRECRAAGISIGEVAKALKRNPSSVRGWYDNNPSQNFKPYNGTR